ncbi:armadillo repeat-containing protein 6-like, partial [Sinocyclocheilus rhinocerous]|uniref:armadillo repeat-containing protein 6-like n=1 Tax=Sinocyclocheilus rhinocerous TaxID=307959 RepID=UPI0007BA39E6
VLSTVLQGAFYHKGPGWLGVGEFQDYYQFCVKPACFALGSSECYAQALESLKTAVASSSASVLEDLRAFTQQCSLGFAQRYLAAQKEAYPTILACCQRAAGEKEALSVALTALSALTDGQPDLLDVDGREFLMGALTAHQTGAFYHKGPGWLGVAAAAVMATRRITQETFDAVVRENIEEFDLEESEALKEAIEQFESQAHPGNTAVLSELCATLSRLAVRNEFCQDIVDLGGLTFMITLLADSLDRQELVKQVLIALKAIAGNDDVKDSIVNAGGAELIVMAMNRHMASAQVCEQGCAALCVLALRKPNNCKVIMECGGALAALQAMKTHPAEVNVQKQSCMLLRNLVAHTRDFSQLILEMGAEALISQALAAHRDCGDVGRAALRDLGCQVELREFWTGKKGSLSQ